MYKSRKITRPYTNFSQHETHCVKVEKTTNIVIHVFHNNINKQNFKNQAKMSCNGNDVSLKPLGAGGADNIRRGNDVRPTGRSRTGVWLEF